MYGLDWMDFVEKSDILTEQEWEKYCDSTDYLIDNNLWETREGKILKLSMMGTDHIKNCIKMLVRNEYEEGFVFNFVKELIKRNEL